MLAGGGVASSQPEAPASGRPAAHAAKGLGSLPVSARSAVSATLGAASRAYVARRSPTGYRLKGGGVAAHLDAGGVSLQAGGVSLAMTAAGLGRGGRLEPAGVRSVGAKGNRVSLDRGALTEWYAAGPFGIEQGFTLSRRPAGKAGPLTLALRLGGGVRAHLDSGTVLLTRAGRPGMSYGQLWANDAKGRPLRAELQLRGRQASDPRLGSRRELSAHDRPADPAGQQAHRQRRDRRRQVRLRVALSADGNTALIGGPERQRQASGRRGCSPAPAPPGRSRAPS